MKYKKIIFIISLLLLVTPVNIFAYNNTSDIGIFRDAYVNASITAIKSDSKACGFIVEETMRLCAEQGVDVDFVVMRTHVIPVIQIGENQWYGLQYQWLWVYTSYYKNWNNRTVYDNATFKYDSNGVSFITNRTRKTNYGNVFIDKITIPNLRDYLELRNS